MTGVQTCALPISAVPREIENNAYAKFWGAYKVHYGRCPSGVYEVRRPMPCFLVKFRCVCRGRRAGLPRSPDVRAEISVSRTALAPPYINTTKHNENFKKKQGTSFKQRIRGKG